MLSEARAKCTNQRIGMQSHDAAAFRATQTRLHLWKHSLPGPTRFCQPQPSYKFRNKISGTHTSTGSDS